MQNSADEILFRRINSLDLHFTSSELYLFVMDYEINVMQHFFLSIGKNLLFIDIKKKFTSHNKIIWQIFLEYMPESLILFVI